VTRRIAKVDLDAVDAFAEAAHRGQCRNTGDDSAPEIPYIVHPRAVRDILAHEHPDPAAGESWILAVALLHDVLEDCDVHHDTLADEFGENVSAAVRALSKQIKVVPAARKTDAQYWQVLRQAPLAIRRVKAADRVDNLRSCVRWSREKLARKYLDETPREVLPLVADDPFLHGVLTALLDELQARYPQT